MQLDSKSDDVPKTIFLKLWVLFFGTTHLKKVHTQKMAL